MAYEHLVEFTGKHVDDLFKSHIQSELELFLKKEFLYFRDRAEEIALYNEEAGTSCDFRDVKIVYYINPSQERGKDTIVFSVHNKKNQLVLSFTAGRTSGKLIGVTLDTNSAKVLEDTLFELNPD